MTNEELIARLRKADEYEPLGHDGWDAADRIEALVRERDREAKAHEKEIYVWSENYAGLERKLSAAEAKMEKLRGALLTIVDNGGAGSYHLARSTLAEIKGESRD